MHMLFVHLGIISANMMTPVEIEVIVELIWLEKSFPAIKSSLAIIVDIFQNFS